MVAGMQNGGLSYTGARTLTEEQAREWTAMSAGTAIERKFPMYVMPVKDVLALDKLAPYEDVKDKLVEWTPGMGKVLFCSHTWLRFTGPDDEKGSKLALLKALLARICAGKIEDIQQSAAYYGPLTIKGKEMTRDLKSGYVWFDLMSIPQSDRDAQIKAINSIVSYANDSSYFFCLAGPWRHENGSIRDERVWAKRGWCRMEVCANALSPASKPVIVCSSPYSLQMHTPAGMVKRSAFFDTVGHGAFTVDDDRLYLGAVIEALVEVRKAYALKYGDLFMFRVCHAAKAKLLAGDMGVTLPAAEPYEQWMETMRFTEATLRTEGAKTGLTPLRYAAMANRIDIVERMLEVAPGLDAEAPLKMSIPIIEAPKAQTILMAACAWYDNGDMVKLLARHGADICRPDKGVGHNPAIYAAGNHNLKCLDALVEVGTNAKGERVDLFTGNALCEPDLECITIPRFFGPMIMMCEYGCFDGLQRYTAEHPDDFKRLFEEPPKGCPMGMTCITMCINVCGDVDLLMWLCDQAKANGVDGANLALPVTSKRSLKVIGIMKILNRLMKNPPPVVAGFLNIFFGATPLHCACMNGNLGAVEYLLANGAKIDSTSNTMGRTPLMLAALRGHDDICEIMIAAGASLEIRDLKKGRTAAQWAKIKGRKELAERLKPAGKAAKGKAKYEVAPAPPEVKYR